MKPKSGFGTSPLEGASLSLAYTFSLSYVLENQKKIYAYYTIGN